MEDTKDINNEELQTIKKDIQELKECITLLIKTNKPVKKKKAVKKKVVRTTKKIAKAKPPIEKSVPITETHIVSLVKNRTQNTNNRDVTRGRNKSPCRVESIRQNQNRPNLFLTSDIKDSFKKDVKTDKLLSGNLSLSPRRPSITLYEVECQHCHQIDTVSQDMFYVDPDTKEVCYTCNACIRRK